ncbi:DUF3265 domain-containing protein [Vibrio parahaemolyticus]|nr:DUF3265 domain-containing protein [Vibrio parahaemolyticus]
MTKRLRGIWHAWHFRFALGSVIKSLCGSFCSACLHPLTRRYNLVGNNEFSRIPKNGFSPAYQMDRLR